VDTDDADVPRDGRDDGRGRDARQTTSCSAYHEDPEGTAQAFRGGWFHSGDLAVWHPDGTIELRDRAKDVIISGGEKHLDDRGRADAGRPSRRARVRRDRDFRTRPGASARRPS